MMKRRIITLALLLLTLTGLGMRFYPAVADWWNRSHQSRAVAGYAEAVANLDRSRYEAILANAQAYNARLLETGILWHMTGEQEQEYTAQLDATGLGILAYLDIPALSLTLPIYHGTSDDVLQVAIGHLAGTSLPVGGLGTHCSVSAHRGLPSAKWFTDLGQLTEGDRFTLTVLDRTLTYEVDRIRIVLPTELDELKIDPEGDFVTLITCTPYGVNSHRLLVRGRRVENTPGEVVVLAEAVRLEPRIVTFVLSLPLLLLLTIWMMVDTGRRIRYKEVLRLALQQLHRRQRLRAALGAQGQEPEASPSAESHPKGEQDHG